MNNLLPEEKRNEIASKLTDKGVKMVCPMCGNIHFTLVDGYYANSLQSDLQSINIGGTTMPTCAIVCEKCGFVSQHSLGVLELL